MFRTSVEDKILDLPEGDIKPFMEAQRKLEELRTKTAFNKAAKILSDIYGLKETDLQAAYQDKRKALIYLHDTFQRCVLINKFWSTIGLESQKANQNLEKVSKEIQHAALQK